jgi:hypothetical protein
MDVNWNAVASEVMTQVLRVVLPVFIALIIKWAIELWHKLKTEQPDWVPVLDYAAQLAVLAAEQIFGDGHGSEKKQYAIEAIERILAENGLSLDLSTIEDAIEAEVYKWLHHDEPEGEADVNDHN